MLGAAVACSSLAPSFSCWDWEHCTEPESSMPIGGQRRVGCWLPGLGSPHYSWGGVGSSRARCSAQRDVRMVSSKLFLPTLLFFHSNRHFCNSIWHIDLNDKYRHVEQMFLSVLIAETNIYIYIFFFIFFCCIPHKIYFQIKRNTYIERATHLFPILESICTVCSTSTTTPWRCWWQVTLCPLSHPMQRQLAN